jgi:small subunit ribosomal protein S18
LGKKDRYQISYAFEHRKNKRNIVVSKKIRIKYIDYKDADFLLKFVNEQGKFLPRFNRYFIKIPKKVSVAVKRARP